MFCCLPERLELMRTVIRRAQAAAPDDAIIAVMSPSFDIEAVQGCSIRPSQVLRVTEGDDGELVLDLNSQNRDGLRDKAKDTFAGLSAVLSLSLADEPVVDTAELSKKA